jgi:hypothetical protein
MRKYFIWSWALLIFFACKKNDMLRRSLPLRTVIVYMVADNNLDYFAEKDINEMERGWANEYNGNLIVYIDRPPGASPSHPVIYKIAHDTTENITSEIIKIYSEQNSASASVLNSVISDITNLYPAQNYGLVLWSHGSGWLPPNTDVGESMPVQSVNINGEIKVLPFVKSFGQDESKELSIQELGPALPCHFEFMLFDACFMSSIEVLYELRNRADYIIASPTQILSSGFPYDETIPIIFKKTIDYNLIGSTFFNFYDKKTGISKSASIAVIKTDKLEKLAQTFNTLMKTPTFDTTIKNINNLQQFTVTNLGFFYDIVSFINSMSISQNNKDVFLSAYNKCIIYENNTPKILESLELKSCSGISIFCPTQQKNSFFNYYKQYDWFNKSGYYNFFTLYNYN